MARRRQRFGLLALLAGLVAACRTEAVPGPDLVLVSVRAAPPVARVVARLAPEQRAEVLGRAGSDFRGSIPVAPGPHTLLLEAFDARDRRLGAEHLDVTIARGDPAQVRATLGRDGSWTPAPHVPVIEALVSPRSSVVVGTRIALQARVGGVADADVAYAWDCAPAGCGSFEAPDSGSTSWSALEPGTCTITLTAAGAGGGDRQSVQIAVRSRGSSYRYPLRASSNGRYLVDQRGAPFLIKGETAWLAIVNLSEEEQERYLADRAEKGFNAVEVMLVNANYTRAPNPTPPANRHGERPFRVPGHLATPDEAYFERAAAFVDRASRHGIVVLVAPLYLGFDGGHEGWWGVLNAPQNTPDVCRAFGRYLGRKLGSRENVVWVAGGDFAPPPGSEGEARYWEILRGMKEAGAGQSWTGHWNLAHLGGISTDEALFAPAMDLNGVYQYATVYRYAARAYDVTPARPVFLLESTYEREHPGSRDQPFRKAWWWAMLSGSAGILWSNNFIWMAEAARGTYAAEYGSTSDGTVSSWAAERESPGTFEVLHLHALFESLPWHRLIPAGAATGGPEVVVSGRGSGARRIASAATPERDLLVAYVPPTGTRGRSFRLDLSRWREPLRARWYDPSTGESAPIAGGLPARSVDLETPGANRSGTNDWVLVVERAGQ